MADRAIEHGNLAFVIVVINRKANHVGALHEWKLPME
jgi:hypothetical protein